MFGFCGYCSFVACAFRRNRIEAVQGESVALTKSPFYSNSFRSNSSNINSRFRLVRISDHAPDVCLCVRPTIKHSCIFHPRHERKLKRKGEKSSAISFALQLNVCSLGSCIILCFFVLIFVFDVCSFIRMQHAKLRRLHTHPHFGRKSTENVYLYAIQNVSHYLCTMHVSQSRKRCKQMRVNELRQAYSETVLILILSIFLLPDSPSVIGSPSLSPICRVAFGLKHFSASGNSSLPLACSVL